MQAFLSYQTADRHVAAKVRDVLIAFGIQSFMAHEDIHVSAEWRKAILNSIRKADLFVAILSANYCASQFCVQESGIAAFRKSMTIIPLSIDGTIPPGFISHVQSIKIDPLWPTSADILPGIFKHDVRQGFASWIESLRRVNDYRSAERLFESGQPFLSRAQASEIVNVLVAATENGQVCHASLCWKEYLPPLITTHGHLMPVEKLAELTRVIDSYTRPRPARQTPSNIFSSETIQPVFAPFKPVA